MVETLKVCCESLGTVNALQAGQFDCLTGQPQSVALLLPFMVLAYLNSLAGWQESQ